MASEGQGMPVAGSDAVARSFAAWRRETSPIYQALFLTALLVLGGSFVVGFVEGARLFGLPPIQGDATILGRTLLERGDYARALEEFRLAELLDPENYAAARPRLAFTPEMRAPARVERLRSAVQEDPSNAGAQLALGRALLAQGDVAAGLASLERAQDLDARQPGLDATLGRAYLEAGRWAEAERALRAALASAPHPDFHEQLGFALHELGRHEEAAEQFERARALRAPRAERAP